MKFAKLNIALLSIVVSQAAIAESLAERACNQQAKRAESAAEEIVKVKAESERMSSLASKFQREAKAKHDSVVSLIKKNLRENPVVQEYIATTQQLNDAEFNEGIGRDLKYLMYNEESIDKSTIDAVDLAFQRKSNVAESGQGDGTLAYSRFNLSGSDMEVSSMVRTDVFYEKGRMLARVWTSFGPKTDYYGTNISGFAVFDVATGEPVVLQNERFSEKSSKDGFEQFDIAEFKSMLQGSIDDLQRQTVLPDGCDTLLGMKSAADQGKGAEAGNATR